MTQAIHWFGFLLSAFLAIFFISAIYSLGASSNPIWLNALIIIAPNTIGWLIKLTFTGNFRYFPF